jgi:iron complex outermembrane receptor protein
MTPGLQISRYNEVGSYNGSQGGSVYIRGLGASRPGSEIKTYLDGVPVYMGIWNHPLMDLLPLNGIGAIEVDKGPNPMRSGNNLAAVNLQTKRAMSEGVNGEVNASVGSFSTKVLQANLVGRSGDVDFSLAGGDIKSDGARSNGDASLQNAMGKLTKKINQNWSAGGSFLSVNNEVGDPGLNTLSSYSFDSNKTPKSNGVARNTSKTNLLTAFISHQNGEWKGELKFYQNTGENNLTQDPIWGNFISKFDMSGMKLKEEFAPWTNGKIFLGIDQDSVSGSINGAGSNGTKDIPTFKITSPYIGYSHVLQMADGWVLQPSLGVRSYNSNVYNSKSAPNMGATFSKDRTKLYVNYTEGVLYPGAETYSLVTAIPTPFVTNSQWNTIKPTVSKHSEVGLKQVVSDKTQFDFSVFQDQISNRYTWTDRFTGSGTWSNTLPNYKINGTELSISHEVSSQWKLFSGLTTLNSSGLNSKNLLPYAPKTAVSLGLTGRVNGYKVSIDAQRQSSMYSLNQDRGGYTASQVNAFTAANARVAYPMASLGKRGEVYAQINNLFDANYQFNAGYPMPGRNFRVGLIASF